MGRYLNLILALLILVIVAAVSATFFYQKGRQSTWEAAKLLVPLEKDEIYLCVEKTDPNGLTYLTVREISEAANDKTINQRELRLRLQLALNGMNLQEYNNKYRQGKKGL